MKLMIMALCVLLTGCVAEGSITAQTMEEATALCASRNGVNEVFTSTLSMRPALYVECGNGQLLAFTQIDSP